MSEVSPSSELLIQPLVEQLERVLADHCAVVVAPTSNDGVQQSDQVDLLGRFIVTDDLR